MMKDDTDPKNNQSFLSQIKRKRTLFICILLAGIIFGVVLVANRSWRFGLWKTEKELPRLNVPTQGQPQNPFLNPPISIQNSEGCEQKPDGITRDACWQAKAVSEKNATLCKAIQESNPFVSKDACFNLVAHEKKDPSLCASIINPELKKNCKETIK